MKNNLKYLIYQITNKTNGMIYIGAHITDNENDKYMGSGKNIKKQSNWKAKKISLKKFYLD